jgi:hypothetical protein
METVAMAWGRVVWGVNRWFLGATGAAAGIR